MVYQLDALFLLGNYLNSWDEFDLRKYSYYKHIIFTKNFVKSISRKICCILTSQPDAGGSPSQLGGGPPYFRCPVVTSSLYPVRLRISLILSSSGPFAIKAELPFVVVTPVKNKQTVVDHDKM